jgi:precorrin-2 methylase
MALKDLYLIGLGIHFTKHLTTEARQVLRAARVVVHIGDDHRWLKRLNPNVLNLEKLYWTGEDRGKVYARLKRRVLQEMAAGPGVALVTYGHPLFFDDLMNELNRYCKRRGLSVAVVAGISSLDTLSIDLGVDYGDGVQIYEATEAVMNRYPLNRQVHTLLLQLGEYDFHQTSDALDPATPHRYSSLSRYLGRFYPADHRGMIVYSDDGDVTRRRKVRLSDLDRHRRSIFPGTTLYIPPAE